MLCQLNKVMIPEIKEQITEIKSWSENHCNLILNHCNQCNLYLLDVASYKKNSGDFDFVIPPYFLQIKIGFLGNLLYFIHINPFFLKPSFTQ